MTFDQFKKVSGFHRAHAKNPAVEPSLLPLLGGSDTT